MNLKMQLHWSYLYFNSTTTLITRQEKALKPIFGKFLWNIRRNLRLSNPCNVSLLLCIVCRRFRFTTFFKFRNRRLILPSILSSATCQTCVELPHLRFFLQCNISSLASNVTLSTLVAQPSSFVYRMVVEYPQTPSIVLELLHLVLSCGESSHEQLYKRSSMEHGNGMVPVNVSQPKKRWRTRVGL